MPTEFISIIVPHFNRPAFLTQCLQSIHAQTFTDWHCYIVDDGSSGSSFKECLGLFSYWSGKDSRFQVIHTPHQGVSAARNTGILASRGQWIALLDSDDLWETRKLEYQLADIETNTFPLWHTEEKWFRNGQRVNPKKKHQKGGGDQFAASTRLCVISPSAVVFSRSYLTRWGLFDSRFPVAEDYDLWLRVTAHDLVGFNPKPLTIKNGGHSDQLSKTKVMDYWRVQALRKILLFGGLSPGKKKVAYQEALYKMDIIRQGATKRGHSILLQELDDWHNQISNRVYQPGQYKQ